MSTLEVYCAELAHSGDDSVGIAPVGTPSVITGVPSTQTGMIVPTLVPLHTGGGPSFDASAASSRASAPASELCAAPDENEQAATRALPRATSPSVAVPEATLP